MFKLIVPIVMLAGAFALAGCASQPCRDALSYREAQAHAVPVVPDGLKPLTPDPDYQIPPGKVSKAAPTSLAQCPVYPPQVIKPGQPPAKAG
ncbi:MAG TPA: hypothetical protein VFK96_08445 [Gammaproteobacteria bacterium]|nr:hypothetical protein [Gammaproteobacteria bacterium]